MLNIIKNNPYRFLGVCSNSPIRDRIANSNRLKAYLKVGRSVEFPLDLTTSLGLINRTQEGMDNASSSINLAKDQLKYSLFWFINVTPIDKMGIEYLQAGNTEKANELFNKRDDYSSLLNRAVLAMIEDDMGEAIGSITKLIHEDEYRDAFVNAICGSTFTIEEDELAHIFMDTLLEEMSAGKLKELFFDYGTSAEDDDYLKVKAVGEPIDAIKEAIATAKSVQRDDADAQYSAGLRLMNSTKEDLKEVCSILGSDDMEYQMIADNLAKQILQCGINYYNNSDEDEHDEIDKAYRLQNYALSIAVGKLTKDRCKENVDFLKEKKASLPPKEVKYYDKYIKGAIATYALQSNTIANAIELIKKCAPHLASIKSELGSSNSYYLKVSTLVANAALHNIIEEFNSVFNDKLELEVMLDRAGTLAKIKRVLDQAWKAVLYIDKLDMEPSFKNGRYRQNRESLKNQAKDFINIYQTVNLDMRSELQMLNECRTVNDCNKFFKVFPDGKYAAQARNKLEKCEFDACKTTQDCQRFRTKYPNTSLPILSKWEECYYNNSNNTISGLQAYLRDYPNGRYVSTAKSKIDKLTYESCSSLSEYRSYLTKFPNGSYRAQAQAYIAEEECWSKCVTSDSKDLYKDYLAKYPNGRHKTEAEQKASACYIATMVYGDYNHPQVMALREFRDVTLRRTALGRAFIRFYYKNSPSWVEKMKDKKGINNIIRVILDKFIKTIQ